MTIKTDYLIFGGGLSGVVAAYTLAKNGINAILLERDDRLGGANRSYRDGAGRVFDSGHHALDYNRSMEASELFEKVLDGAFRRIPLRRGIVVGGEVFDYGAPIAEWPESLQPLLTDTADVDRIEGEVTRDKIAACFGERFQSFIYETVLPSYPTLMQAIAEGGSESDQMRLIYPWFFPFVPKGDVTRDGESKAFHDSMRGPGALQEILYPTTGGFESFPLSIARKAEEMGCRIMIGERNLEIDFASDGCTLRKVGTSIGDIVADHYLWCAPVPVALRIFGQSLPMKTPQDLHLGNFTFDREISETRTAAYNEILVGDINHAINRITFPGRLSGDNDRTMQVEFMTPATEEYAIDANDWRDRWENSLRSLGLIDDGIGIEEFSHHRENRGFVVAITYDDLMDQCRELYDATGTNLEVPYLALGPENINRLIPGVISYIEETAL